MGLSPATNVSLQISIQLDLANYEQDLPSSAHRVHTRLFESRDSDPDLSKRSDGASPPRMEIADTCPFPIFSVGFIVPPSYHR